MDATNFVFFGVVAVVVAAMSSEVALIEAPGRAWGTSLAFGAVIIAISEILGHLRNYNNRTQQRYVIRILLMVPIYALDSLWGFFDRGHSGAIDLARDTYEAYVIYNFFHLLLDMNGGVNETVAYWRARKPTMPHMFPLRGEMILDKSAITLWRFFMMQYVIISPLLTLLTYVFSARGMYDENSWSAANTHLWLSLIRCASVTFAFTALLYFYLATKYNIHDMNPTGKFLSIKAVIFLGCWQGVAISMMETFDVFPENKVRDFLFRSNDPIHSEAAVAAFENWLVIAEMFGAVLAHHFVFSYKGFDGSAAPHGAHGHSTTTPQQGQQGYLSPQRSGAAPRRVNAALKPSFLENLAHALSVVDVAEQARENVTDARRVVSERVATPTSATGPARPGGRPPVGPARRY